MRLRPLGLAGSSAMNCAQENNDRCGSGASSWRLSPLEARPLSGGLHPESWSSWSVSFVGCDPAPFLVQDGITRPPRPPRRRRRPGFPASRSTGSRVLRWTPLAGQLRGQFNQDFPYWQSSVSEGSPNEMLGGLGKARSGHPQHRLDREYPANGVNDHILPSLG